MAKADELRLMTKVALMYHERSITQSDIAEQLELSQATVSRLLKKARQEKIIRTIVSVPPGAYPELEEALQKSYNLKDVIVVDCETDADSIEREIGAAAAYYVETTLKQDEVIGISSWSATLLAMVDSMHPLARRSGAQVVQILGGVGNPLAEVHAARITTRLASLVHGSETSLPAPGVVGSPESLQIMQEDQFVKAALVLFDKVTLALVGVGSVAPSKLLASSGNVFSTDELGLLREHGAVGDVCLRFFDAQGQPVVTPLNERVIGISLEQLKRVQRSVGIAGGKRKTAAIQGALAGGWINVLITDHFTARRLVK
ncbi:MAG TPA: sugar-binding transcriptional regulator [Caldilineaceae bacterium]|nr:sugar-binding transcriptional regulator [Caldilineaceae bacterium]